MLTGERVGIISGRKRKAGAAARSVGAAIRRLLGVKEIRAQLVAQSDPSTKLQVNLGRVGSERSSHELALVGPVKRIVMLLFVDVGVFELEAQIRQPILSETRHIDAGEVGD